MIQIVDVEGNKVNLYMDNGLYNQLTNFVMPSVKKKDFDWLAIVDGQEGSGKSIFSFQIAKTLFPNFSLLNVVFTPDDFIKAVINAKPFSCIVFDEAFTGLSSRTSLSEINNLLVSLMMEMRQKNLFIIIVMPTFFMLDKYCVLHRAKGLFHVYMKNGKRGFWNFYNKRAMKMLYLDGKKYYEYGGVKPIMFGRFQDQWMVHESKYREEKRKHLYQKKRITKVDRYIEQRDALIWILSQECALSQQEISDLCKKFDFTIARKSISDILIKFKMRQDKKSIFEPKIE